MEPILQESKEKFVLFPIKYPEIYRLAKVQAEAFWTVEECDLRQDLVDLPSLSPNERHFLFHVLAFFAAADGIVMENIEANFAQEVKLSLNLLPSPFLPSLLPFPFSLFAEVCNSNAP